MKVFLAAVICALFIGFSEARSKPIDLDLKLIEKLLRRQLSATTTTTAAPTTTTTAAPPPPTTIATEENVQQSAEDYLDHVCFNPSEKDKQIVGDLSKEIRRADDRLFQEMWLFANQLPEPEKFTCDNRFDIMFGYISVIHMIAAYGGDEGKDFLWYLTEFFMNLASKSIWYPLYVEKFIENKVVEKGGFFNEGERSFQRTKREYADFTDDEITNDVMKWFCFLGQLNEEDDLMEIIQMGVWFLNDSTALLRSWRVLMTVEGGVDIVNSTANFVGELASVMITNRTKAMEMLQNAIDKYKDEFLDYKKRSNERQSLIAALRSATGQGTQKAAKRMAEAPSHETKDGLDFGLDFLKKRFLKMMTK